MSKSIQEVVQGLERGVRLSLLLERGRLFPISCWYKLRPRGKSMLCWLFWRVTWNCCKSLRKLLLIFAPSSLSAAPVWRSR